MEEKVRRILDEAILLEKGMARLYLLFSEIFQEDEKFWKQISKEEMHHASLIELGEELFEYHRFPEGIIYDNFEIQSAYDTGWFC